MPDKATVEAAIFLSTPSARRATEYLYRSYHTLGGFLSTPSARRATRAFGAIPDEIVISIHALREEGDEMLPFLEPVATNFYPRPPRGGRPCWLYRMFHRYLISIHALREEGDISRPAPHGT